MAFSKSTKRAIDYSIPSLAAFGAVWFFITQTKDRDIKFIILVLVLVFVFTYAITSQITKAAMEASLKKNVNVPLDNIKVSTDTTGKETIVGAVSSENISQITQALRDDIYDTSFLGHDSDLWWKVSLLSNSDMGAVYNQWNKDFYSEHSESLVKAIKNEIFLSGFFGGDGAYFFKETVLGKLASIGAK